ncbi:MAG: TetR/AcrR family transcriptional regulator [Asticcacaulis sp.]|uniref:TetR/AcrR family transcriptional regulator n=1 Tax=Asticcacaulis sp. TaxID=1872648 RepID=UPI0039E28AEE
MPSPNIARSRTKPADVRQEELMDAALALFVEKGIAATSIDEIVTAAGVSKGGFYHHFASKDALLTALQDRYVSRFLAILVEAQSRLPEDDWRGRMNVWLRTGIDLFFEELRVHDVVFHEFAPADRREMNQNPVVDYMEAFLKAGTAAGAWQADYPRLLAVMLFNALHGACDEVVLSPDMMDHETLIETLQAFFWRAVSPGGK